MEDARCVKCQLFITEDPLICDGICGSQYHRECIRRTTRQGNVNSFTCSPCNDIKPCHILKAFLVMNAKTEAILDKTSDLEKSIATLISNFNILFSDREVILSSIDKLNVSNGSLVEIFSKFADLAKKNNSLTKQLENTLSDINITPDLSSLKEEMADISFSIRGFEERIRAMISLPSCRNVASPPSIDASGATSFSGGSAPTPHRNSSKCHSFSSDSPALANSSRSRSELPSPLLAPSISAVGDQVSPPPSRVPSPSGTPHSPEHLPGSPSTPINGINHTPETPSIPVCDISWVPKKSFESTSLYVGRCATSTSTDSIKNFISSQLCIPISGVRCRRLVNPARPLSDLSFVSFKVDIPSSYAQSALSHHWPSPSRVSLFQNRIKSATGRLPRVCPSPSKNSHNPQPPGEI